MGGALKIPGTEGSGVAFSDFLNPFAIDERFNFANRALGMGGGGGPASPVPLPQFLNTRVIPRPPAQPAPPPAPGAQQPTPSPGTPGMGGPAGTGGGAQEVMRRIARSGY